ncbi:MAG TPA: alpha/beta fold hydrolase [Thermoanaerobaculia bacterium]|nr:alpha/beta fold hydrolase [Thermoanaerobaculia bacterium]
MRLLLVLAAIGGYWTGTVTTPGGALPVGIFIGPGSAALDAPSLGYAGKPVALRVEGDAVHLELDADGKTASADATLSGDRLTGLVTLDAAKFPIDLKRSAQPEKSYRTEGVTIRNGEVSLDGTLYLPKADRAVPAVAFVAGLVPRSDAVHFLADRFASRGIAVLTYDRRGVGKSTGPRRASFAEHAADAAAAVAYLRSRAEIDAARVGIRGQSQGAWLAPLAATRVPVAFIIATAGGGVPPWQSETYAIPARMRADGFSAAEVAEAAEYMRLLFEVARSGQRWDALSAMTAALRAKGSVWLGRYAPVYDSLERLRQTWEGEFSYDPVPLLREIKVPFLALVGENDVYSPPTATIEALNRSLTTSDKTIRLVRGATHDFHVAGAPLPLVSEEYLHALVDWTEAHAGLQSTARSVEGHAIVSRAPKLRIEVDPSLPFIGSFAMNIRDAARAERYVFAEADAAGNVRRMLVAQFEAMLTQHRGAYDVPKNAKFVPIGPLQFQQVAGKYNFAAAIAAKPGAEAERTREFLLSKGLRVDRDLMVARFEAHTDPDHRSELIIFYWEDAAVPPEQLLQRAREMFRVF